MLFSRASPRGNDLPGAIASSWSQWRFRGDGTLKGMLWGKSLSLLKDCQERG